MLGIDSYFFMYILLSLAGTFFINQMHLQQSRFNLTDILKLKPSIGIQHNPTKYHIHVPYIVGIQIKYNEYLSVFVLL